MLIQAGYEEGGRLAQIWYAFRNFFLVLPYKYSQSRWNLRGLLVNARWRLHDQRAALWEGAWQRFPLFSRWWALLLIQIPGWHSWLFLRKRVTVTCDGVDVTNDCFAYNRRAGLVRCYVAAEDGSRNRVIAIICSRCGQEPPEYAERYKSPEKYSARLVRRSGPKGMPRCPWCGGRWTQGALRVERAGRVEVALREAEK